MYDEQLDKITQRELNPIVNEKINLAHSHISDTVPHVSTNDRNRWDSAADMPTATGSNDGLFSKEDKAKLDAIEENANNYIHPEHHAPSIIAQDANNRFVTDYDIKNWNGKKDQDEIICGSGILNSTEGAVILHTMGGTNYAANITFTTRPEDVGMLWVEKYNDSCVVKCTGTTRTVEFDYTLIKYYK